MKILITKLKLAAIIACLAATQAAAQVSERFDVPASQAPYDGAELELLVGPIALYADDLIGIVLPASTYPLQVVQASRFLDELENDDSLQPDPDWDDSVVALLNYPELLRTMDENLEWTWALGEAVLDQQPEVLDAIQGFRLQALRSGNLASNDRQVVNETVNDDGTLIEIAPANPEVIYIPYYEPERVVVYQPRPVIHYYTLGYPNYYYPYPIGYRFGYRFGSSFFWGVTSAFDIGWHSHVVHVYHHRHRAHPYYNRVYYTPFYARRTISLGYRNQVWQHRQRPAARPRRTETRTVVTRERGGAIVQPPGRASARSVGRNAGGRDFASGRTAVTDRTIRSTGTQSRSREVQIPQQRTTPQQRNAPATSARPARESTLGQGNTQRYRSGTGSSPAVRTSRGAVSAAPQSRAQQSRAPQSRAPQSRAPTQRFSAPPSRSGATRQSSAPSSRASAPGSRASAPTSSRGRVSGSSGGSSARSSGSSAGRTRR